LSNRGPSSQGRNPGASTVPRERDPPPGRALTHPDSQDRTMDYRHHGPFLPASLAIDRCWFCGGRIGVRLARHGGISELAYCGVARRHQPHRRRARRLRDQP
jgi:hypothetical protein